MGGSGVFSIRGCPEKTLNRAFQGTPEYLPDYRKCVITLILGRFSAHIPLDRGGELVPGGDWFLPAGTLLLL